MAVASKAFLLMLRSDAGGSKVAVLKSWGNLHITKVPTRVSNHETAFSWKNQRTAEGPRLPPKLSGAQCPRA